MAERDRAPREVQELAEVLCQPVPMRRGSLSERYMKCGKAQCPCHVRPEARHGPYFTHTRVVNGRTQSRFLSATQAERLRAQVAAGQEFRRRIEAYWSACEQWADAELQLTDTTAEAEAEKKGSRRTSRRPPAARSRRS
jgi:hypothetical protein